MRMSGQDDHWSPLFTFMFLLGSCMLVRSSYCHVIFNILTSQKRDMTKLKFQWPAIFPILDACDNHYFPLNFADLQYKRMVVISFLRFVLVLLQLVWHLH